jgi:hypothetical protein
VVSHPESVAAKAFTEAAGKILKTIEETA